jgi:pyridoxine 5-phosphate synthase
VLRATVRTRLVVHVPLAAEAVKLVTPIRPDLVVLVPERGEAHGQEPALDLTLTGSSVGDAAATLKEAGLTAMALVAPDPEQVKIAHRVGLPGVVLLGSRLGASRMPETRERELEVLDRCAKLAAKLGQVVHVAHGLDLAAVTSLRRVTGLGAVEVGHALCARAVLLGMERAVRDFRTAIG